MQRGEERHRWTDGFDGDELGVFRMTERDCSCGLERDAVRVLTGARRGRNVHRRLRCDCGRTWQQVAIAD